MKYRNSPKNTRGAIFFAVLIAVGVITLALTVSLERSRVDSTIAGSWNRRARAKGIAETGLGITAQTVASTYASAGNFNSLLGTIQLGSTNGGQYSVLVADNNNVGGFDQDGNGSATTDADRIFRLVSTGKLGSVEHVVEAFYRIQSSTSSPPGSTGIGAVGLCTNNVDINKAGNIQGADWNIPSYGCSGSGCDGTASTNATRTGLSYNSDLSVRISSGTPTGSPGTNSNAGIDCTTWTNFMTSTAALTAAATYNAAAGPFNASDVATNFGTDTAPKVTVITGPGTAQFNGNLYGNGILIIRNANAKFNGTFTYAGLIIIENDGGAIELGGSAQIFGSVMVLSASSAGDSQTELNFQNTNTPIHYSTQGLAKASSALTAASPSGGVSTLAWHVISH